MDYLEELKQRKIWMNFILYPKPDGSVGKPPINAYTLRNGHADKTGERVTYETAIANVGKPAIFHPSDASEYTAPIEGNCIVLTGDVAAIDLDHVVKNGEIIAPFAKQMVESFDTYTELSVSGTGLHMLMYADDIATNAVGKYHVDGEGNYQKNGEYTVEIFAYTQGHGQHCLTVTEKIFHEAPIQHGKGTLLRKTTEFYNTMKGMASGTQTAEYTPVDSGDLPEEAVEKVLKMAFKYDYDGTFRKLYEGETSLHGGDHSAADQALVNKLASWTKGNAELMDRIFRNSGLMRSKWDRKLGSGTYGSVTIGKAIEWYRSRNPEENGLKIEDVQQAVANAQKQAEGKAQVSPVNTAELTKLPPKDEKKQIKPLTYDNAVEILQNANDDRIEIPHFESFAETAKIGQHDTVIIAGETGSGKSMLALNLMENLNENYAVMYFNLEMTTEMVLRRMVAINTGLDLDRVEGYKHDQETQKSVNEALKQITSRQPIYVENDRYKLEQIEDAIKQAVAIQEENGRKEPVIVFIDHVLLLRNVGKASSNYERYSGISEELRRIAVLNNCIVFVLTQQSRAGKADRDKEPELSSLKESGSFENDSTHVTFIWRSGTDGRYYLVLRKNRKGTPEKKWELDIDFRTQTIRAPREALDLQSIPDLTDAVLPEARPTRARRKQQ